MANSDGGIGAGYLEPTSTRWTGGTVTSKKLLLLIVLTVVVFAGLIGYGDFKEIGRQLPISRSPIYLLHWAWRPPTTACASFDGPTT